MNVGHSKRYCGSIFIFLSYFLPYEQRSEIAILSHIPYQSSQNVPDRIADSQSFSFIANDLVRG